MRYAVIIIGKARKSTNKYLECIARVLIPPSPRPLPRTANLLAISPPPAAALHKTAAAAAAAAPSPLSPQQPDALPPARRLF